MGITVLKFGGTSLRDIDRNSDFLKRIKDTYRREERLVVVVSAIGRMGEPYATDTLIYQLEKVCKDIDPKKKDFIMSCGETISAAIVSHLLESEGLNSEPLMGFQAGILTNNEFTCSKILEININKILTLLDEGKIVVVTGFQGITKEMEITTLGRGGSDTTAVALGAYLDAERVDIYTDVPGVALIDPRIVPYTKYIDKLSYSDMYNLSVNGATVIHPRAVKIGEKYNIPIRVLSTFTDGEGTLISKLDNRDKIVGFAIKDDNDIKIISIVIKAEYMEGIKNDLSKLLLYEKDKILNVGYYENRIAISVKAGDIEYIGQSLYDYLI